MALVVAAGHHFFLEGFQPKKKKEIQAEIVSRGGKITFMLNKEVAYYCADSDWTGRSTKLAKVQKDHPNVKIITEAELRKQLALLPLVVVAPPAPIETVDQQQDAEAATVVENQELPLFSPQKTAATATPKGPPTSASKRPLTRSAPSTPSKQQKNVVLAPRIPTGPDAPSVTLVLPETIPIHGDCRVAIFGLNFKPGSAFRIAFGSRIIDDGFEFHCGTALVLHLPVIKALPPGDLLVSASNDSGRHFGMSTRIRAVDSQLDLAVAKPHDEKMALLAGQVQNLSRALQQLQSGFENASKLEAALRGELQGAGAPGLFELDHKHAPTKHHPPQIAHAEPSRPAPAVHAHVAKPSAVVAAAAAPVAPQLHSEPDREIKIFISSPFKDLQEERNLMVKRMIPRLKKMCMERDVVLTYVDLRWGVTDVQGEQAAALLMCLRELDKSNLMIGCFGERYGWCLSEGAHIAVKKSEKDKLLERSFDIAAKEFPWIEEFRDRSMTEVEMRMHMLNKSSVSKKAWFYLRDPYYLESIPVDQKPNFVSEGEFEHAKLESLKEELRSGYNALEYHRPAEFAETVTRDIETYIEQKFPRENKLSADESERFRHRAFAKFLCRIYLPNEANTILLDKYVSGSKQSPLVVSGETGTGKSSLLANWSLRHASHHPEDIVISHFVGCTPASTGYLNTINRIMTDLADVTGQHEARPSNENLITEWPAWVERVLKKAQRHKLVLVIDGLDALDERDKAHDLIWLPFSFPASVRVVLSTSSGQCMNVLKRRGYEMLEVRPLEEGERIAFLRMYLNWNSKKLSDKQEFTIAAAKQTANPRFLKILLEDICVFGDFAALDKRIESDLKAKNASELYEIVLERVERDYDADKKNVVRTFMSYIWGSRRGLMLDSELRPLLEEKNINPSEWEPIVLVLEDILFSAGGLLNFSNRDIQKAVENRYLKKDSMKKEVHQKLASLFAKYEGAPARKMDEWPYQLFKAGEWAALVDCLSTLDNFCLLSTPERKYDLNAYWRAIEKNSSGVDCVSTYQRALVDGPFPADMIRADVYFKIGSFLEEIARFDGAEKAYKEAVLHYRNSAQNLDVARANGALARLYITTSKHDLAEQLLNDTLEVYNREHGDGSLDASHVMNRLGALYLDSNQLEKAEANFKKALQIRAAKLGPTHSRVGQTLKHMLTLYELQGRWDEATECGQRALQITETEFGPEDVNVAGILRRMGRLLMNQSKFTEAIETLNRALAIAELKYGPDHPNTGENIYGLGCVAFLQNKYDEAEELFRKALRIKELSLGEDHPEVATIVNRLGTLYIEQSRFADAESAFTRALASYEKKLGPNHSRVGQVLKHMLTLFELQERFDKALECGLRALRITEKIFGPDHFHVSSVLLRLGPLQWTMGDIERGRESLIRSISIREKARGATDKAVTEAKKILTDLENPPLPPAPATPAPPPPPPSKEECKPPPATPSRTALLDEIRKRGERKQKEQEKQAQQQQQQLQQLQQVECESASAGKKAMHKQWWKQNYNYNAAFKKGSPQANYGSPQAYTGYGSPVSASPAAPSYALSPQPQQQQMAPRAPSLPPQPAGYPLQAPPTYAPQPQQQQQQQMAPRVPSGYPPQAAPNSYASPASGYPPQAPFKPGMIPTRMPPAPPSGASSGPPRPPPAPPASSGTSLSSSSAAVPPNTGPLKPPPPPPPPPRH